MIKNLIISSCLLFNFCPNLCCPPRYSENHTEKVFMLTTQYFQGQVIDWTIKDNPNFLRQDRHILGDMPQRSDGYWISAKKQNDKKIIIFTTGDLLIQEL